jgi:hypothetical protein
MNYPVTLVDIASIAIAVGCLRSTWPDLRGAPRKLYLLGLPPLLGIVVALVILAESVVTFEHDAIWMATALAGGLVGLWRGRQISVQIDQVWGVVRTAPVRDTVIAAAAILAVAVLDGISGLFQPGTMPRHAYFAAASALFAGYLVGRAYSVVWRAMRSPHTELETH